MTDSHEEATRRFVERVLERVPELRSEYAKLEIGEEILDYPLMSVMFDFMRRRFEGAGAAGAPVVPEDDALRRCAEVLDEGLEDPDDAVGNLVFVGFLENLFYDETKRRVAAVLGPRCREELRRVLEDMERRTGGR